MDTKIGIKGKIEYTLYDKDGNIKNSGVVTNTITELLDAHVADQMSDSSDAQIGFIALGSGTGQTSASTDVANYVTETLIALSGTGPVQGTGAADNDVVYSGYWGTGVGTGPITEAGIFLGSATVRADMMTYNDGLSITKDANDAFKLNWTITYGAS